MSQRARVELVPDRLFLEVREQTWTTNSGTFPCVVLLTEGLLAIDQKEIIFAFERDPHDDLNTVSEFASVVNFIFEEACRGNIVDVGARTSLMSQQPGFLQSGGYEGILYTYPTNYWPPGPLMDKYLGAVLVKASEREIAEQYGHSRVLAKLGQRHLYYPFPPFAERSREPLFESIDMDSCLIAKAPRISCYDSCVWMSGFNYVGNTDAPGDMQFREWRNGPLHLVVGRSSAPRITEFLSRGSQEGAFAILTSVYPELKRCLVYEPPPVNTGVIHDANHVEERCAGNFILFAGAPESRMHANEDGFGLLVDDRRWQELMKALESGSPYSIPEEDEFSGFDLTWRG